MLITIEKAENLPAMDLNGNCDPFARVTFDGKEVFVTNSIKKALNPIWHATTSFKISCNSKYIVVEVWDKDELTNDDYIGSCRVFFSEDKTEWVKLVKGKHARGRILITTKQEELDKQVLSKLPFHPDVRDFYPPHDKRFRRHYHHIPRSWHPNSQIRKDHGPKDLVFPQNEVVLFMVDEITLMSHVTVGSNTGELAAMILTSYRLWFVPYKQIEHSQDVYTIAVGKIDKIYLNTEKKSGNVIVIENMDGSIYHAILTRTSGFKDEEKIRAEAQRITLLNRVIEEIEWLKAENDFCYKHSHEIAPHGIDVENLNVEHGIEISFDMYLRNSVLPPVSKLKILDDFERQGALRHPKWRVTDVNLDYNLCSTYPNALLVPSSISDEILLEAASYRSKCRIPALTWLHPNGASLCRSSQPKSGVLGGKNSSDIELIWAIRDAAVIQHALKNEYAHKNKLLHIVDARPVLSARANSVAGKGHESVKHYDREGYSCARIVFMGIDNIHVVRSSFASFSEACYAGDDSSFFSGIHQSKWYEHIVSVLSGAVEIVHWLSRGEPCLVHCSDGWDRTSQLTSLAQIMLDPYYRTLEGFAALVEKDWCHFGFMFEKRCRFPKGDNTSQIFILFLDATYQLICQFPYSFQFNASFLVEVCDAVYSGWYGNFVQNCEQERAEIIREKNLVSLWDVLRSNTDRYLNPMFESTQIQRNKLEAPLIPACKVRCMRLWTGLYQRALSEVIEQSHINSMHELIQSQEQQITALLRILTPDQHLELHVMQIDNEIQRLQCLIQLDHSAGNGNVTLPKQSLHSKGKNNEIITVDHAMELTSNNELKERIKQLQRRLDNFQNYFESQTENAASALIKFRDQASKFHGEDYDVLQANPNLKPTPIWQHDHETNLCTRCRKRFNHIYRKRHHCRACGYIFCGNCSNHFRTLPEYGYHDNVRVCNTCDKVYAIS